MSLALLALAAVVSAAPPPPPPPPPVVDCHDQAHRALDFWIGDWTVTATGSDKPLARSRIEAILDGCAIKESYSQTVGPGGAAVDYQGTSYTALNAVDGGWRQFYVDNKGSATSFVGGLDGVAMVLTAHAGAAANRMTVTPQPDGSVRQAGAVSLDGGKTWTPGYDFNYRRRPAD